MAEEYDTDSTTHNGVNDQQKQGQSTESLYGAVLALLSPIFFPDPHHSYSSSCFSRARESFKENLPHLREASRTSGLKVLSWARQGSPLRLLLVISVGTITLLTLTGILVSLLFVAAATINAIIISLFMSLAAAGGFLAIFFACVAVIYVGALSVAVFVISSATISAIITVLIVTGWIGFFWTVWVAIRKTAGLAKHSVNLTGSAVSAYTSAWHTHRQSHNHHD